MNTRVIIAAIAALLPAVAFAQASPRDITPAPKEVSVSDGTVAWPFPVEVYLGDRDFRRRVYHLPEFAHKEAYEIIVSRDGVVINAVTDKSLFYAKNSLAQMIAASDTLSCCHIIDYPEKEVRPRDVFVNEYDRTLDRVLLHLEMARFAKNNVLRIHGNRDAYPASERARVDELAKQYFVEPVWIND